jgi:hypothetical protein
MNNVNVIDVEVRVSERNTPRKAPGGKNTGRGMGEVLKLRARAEITSLPSGVNVYIPPPGLV